jgi:chemotaxis protein methyltransferase CheR
MKRLAESIGAWAGLDPPPWLLEARVQERAAELGLDQAGYLSLVDGGGEAARRERTQLIDRLRVGETRFFRHQAQLEALRAQVLPSLFGRGVPVRVWSAGCASGEEAFTLALLCEEAAPREPWEVIGSDLSAGAIAAAEAARWPSARLDEIPDAFRRHFVVDGPWLAARPELRARVRFAQQNLLDPRSPRAVDLALCRNVLIYFDAERRAAAIARLSESLRPGGWLCLGYSESLRNQEEARLEQMRVGEAVLYRRREITAKIELPRPGASESATANESANERAKPTAKTNAGASETILRLRGEYADATRLQSELRPFLAAPAVVDLDGALFLSDDAARVLQRARQAAPSLKLRATRAPILRWLAKHGLDQ